MKAPPDLTAAIRAKCGETGHTFVAREVAGESVGVCAKCGQIAGVKESADAKLVDWYMTRLVEAKEKLEDAQAVVYELARLLARIRRQDPQMVEEAEKALHMTPRGAEH